MEKVFTARVQMQKASPPAVTDRPSGWPCRHCGGSERAVECMWRVVTAASDAFSNWADAVAAADGRLAAGHDHGLPLVLAAQAIFRSQVSP